MIHVRSPSLDSRRRGVPGVSQVSHGNRWERVSREAQAVDVRESQLIDDRKSKPVDTRESVETGESQAIDAGESVSTRSTVTSQKIPMVESLRLRVLSKNSKCVHISHLFESVNESKVLAFRKK